MAIKIEEFQYRGQEYGMKVEETKNTLGVLGHVIISLPEGLTGVALMTDPFLLSGLAEAVRANLPEGLQMGTMFETNDVDGGEIRLTLRPEPKEETPEPVRK